MAEKNVCACGSAPKLIFACSGAADVGAVADQAARKLTKDGAEFKNWTFGSWIGLSRYPRFPRCEQGSNVLAWMTQDADRSKDIF